jgi:NADH-quinone oxidoreductase subunit J
LFRVHHLPVFCIFCSRFTKLEAEFLAITLILVYVGAVMVLFLFVIKMLNIDKSTLRAKFAGYLPLGLLVAAVIVTEMAMVLGYNQFGLDVMAAPARHGADHSNIENHCQRTGNKPK